ncbi:MFS transporter [Rhodopseudomonas sp. B29]|uniref:MFS transporter n=1 Tax=Rhodopseudomonas sp. B29 TaxID=95607 RepID=UPI000346AC44
MRASEPALKADVPTSQPPSSEPASSESAAPGGAADQPALGQGLTLAMAAAAGIAVANIYYNQPMLGIMERDLGSPDWTGMIPTATQLGYAAGLFLLVPLGDLMDRHRLIVAQFILLAVALVATALAPSAILVIVASLALGAFATVAQQIVPFAAALARPQQRGKAIGTVMAGLLCGILLSRTVSGFVAGHSGWREMYWLSVPLALGAAALMAWLLPRRHPYLSIGYGTALKSVLHLWRDQPALRRATAVQACLFASFSVFWTVLALHLQEPRLNLGAAAAGLFGLVGVVGVLAAPIAGRIADRSGPAPVIAAGAVLALLSWALFGFWDVVPGLVLGVVILDFGLQSSLISNQHIVYALVPEARSRLNTVFMTGMFVGGAIGSAGASVAWAHGGWFAVCLYGGGLAALALILELTARWSSR